MTTVVFIPGAFCGGGVWDRFAGYFRDAGYAVRVLELPHHQRRDSQEPLPALATLRLKEVAAHLAAQIRKLQGPFVLAGHSLGGFLAQLLAKQLAKEGLRAAGVICFVASGPASVSKQGTFGGLLMTWRNLFRRNALGRPWKCDRRKAIELMMNRLPLAQQQREADELRWESYFVLSDWAKNREGIADLVPADLPCRLLIVAAEDDLIVRPQYVKRVADYYGAQADYLNFPNRDHWLIAGPGWEAVAEACHRWLKNGQRV